MRSLCTRAARASSATCSSPMKGRPPDRRQVEARLLAHVIETLQQSPGIHRVEAQLLVHEAGALARPFLDQGFRRHPRLFMAHAAEPALRVRLRRFILIFEIRRWHGERLPVRGCRDHRGLSWTCGFGDQRPVPHSKRIAAFPQQHRALSRMRHCSIAESSFVVTHKSTRNVAGLILCSRVRHDVGHVTQVCVLPEYRSHGIGEALLACTAGALQQAQVFAAVAYRDGSQHRAQLNSIARLGFDVQASLRCVCLGRVASR